MAGPNHQYTYQTETEPNRFVFTPDQVVFCCLDHGRAKKAPHIAIPTNGGMTVTLTLGMALIEKSCRTDVRFHGGCRPGSIEKYIHADGGGLTIEIQEPE